jgi:hypothetical protein
VNWGSPIGILLVIVLLLMILLLVGHQVVIR